MFRHKTAMFYRTLDVCREDSTLPTGKRDRIAGPLLRIFPLLKSSSNDVASLSLNDGPKEFSKTAVNRIPCQV